MHESEDETSLFSLLNDQSVQKAGSFIKIYVHKTGNTLLEKVDANQASTPNRIREATIRGDKHHIDDLAFNGRNKKFSKKK